MSWWSSNPLDELIDKATSETLPSGFEDWALTLEICDQIRSKSVAPKDAMKALKRRLENKNPNVQLSTLRLIDACVKNGGDHFLVEVASKEFIDNMSSLLKSTVFTNAEVKSRILELMQVWVLAFQGKPHLHYVEEAVKSLKYEGINWTMFDMNLMNSITAGIAEMFSAGSAQQKLFLSPVLALYNLSVNAQKLKHQTGTRPLLQTPATPPAREDAEDDEDLKTALRLSLEDSTKIDLISKPAPARSSSYQPKTTSKPKDDDLEAAIQASLRDVEEAKKKVVVEPPTQSPLYKSHSSTKTVVLYDLSPVETESITLFSTLIERLKSAPIGTVTKEPQIQELHDSIGALRPKLARALAETMNKHETLLRMHSQIGKAVHIYDQLLESRFSMTTIGRQGRYSSYMLSAPQQYLPHQNISQAASASYFDRSDNPIRSNSTSYNQRELLSTRSDYPQPALAEHTADTFSPVPFVSQYPTSNTYLNSAQVDTVPVAPVLASSYSQYPNDRLLDSQFPPYQITRNDGSASSVQNISATHQHGSTTRPFQVSSQAQLIPEYYAGGSDQQVGQPTRSRHVEEVSLIDL
ncbi:Vacuolar protein sorting-associated protein 27 [Neolecta irregularis DAH-3]|uniref:Vacuolar protein sorting-associated protein 27 n=1 Tax=Neolecta irregularis (strain DAH-3) TaxID=1198029 RepID=A0A1U7LVE9_NEOID|nr:Vacuolar protein sorting-associated protein 27 [Neolecta irregularis DAH-3]|eukprot:OLL26650.1 Vacuolar protein sorting-associated protein 27 [Neolecta irregularis DAH-3]